MTSADELEYRARWAATKQAGPTATARQQTPDPNWPVYSITTTDNPAGAVHGPNGEHYALFCEPGQVSDGYHTFDELYAHRCRLFVALLLCADCFTGYENAPFKTRCDDKGDKLDGWFIGGMDTPHGQITYHLPDEWWDKLPIRTEPSNAGYDGHTAADVLARLDKVINDWS